MRADETWWQTRGRRLVDDGEFLGGGFAVASRSQLESHFLTLAERPQSRPLDGGDVDEG